MRLLSSRRGACAERALRGAGGADAPVAGYYINRAGAVSGVRAYRRLRPSPKVWYSLSHKF